MTINKLVAGDTLTGVGACVLSGLRDVTGPGRLARSCPRNTIVQTMFIGLGLTAVILLLIYRCICRLPEIALVVPSRCTPGLLDITSPPFNHFNVLIRAKMRSSVCHRLLRGRFLLDEFRVICKAGLASLSSSNFTIVVY
jgi:hypothetical protein